jgi:hypothetical protein
MMKIATRTDLRSRFLDKREFQRLVAEENARVGFVPDPTATAEKAQEMMLARGIRPEENHFSTGIMAARDEE